MVVAVVEEIGAVIAVDIVNFEKEVVEELDAVTIAVKVDGVAIAAVIVVAYVVEAIAAVKVVVIAVVFEVAEELTLVNDFLFKKNFANRLFIDF